MENRDENILCLVTGVTGYIGGRLVPWLLERGYRVRVLTRDSDRLQGRTKLVQTVYFAPKGLPGLHYWDILYPFHGFIFSSVIERVANAEKHSSVTAVPGVDV